MAQVDRLPHHLRVHIGIKGDVTCLSYVRCVLGKANVGFLKRGERWLKWGY